MTDIVSKQKRSEMMSRISSKDTQPELTVRKALHKAGYRFRLHYRSLPGKPDIVMPKYKLSIFIHGCFWHRHSGCKFAYEPKTRKEFWENKFNTNLVRDRANIDKLISKGWKVLVIWECFTKKREHIDLVNIVEHAIHGQGKVYEYPPSNTSEQDRREYD